MAVITVSRQYGSGGDEIAQKLCEVLHFAQFDKRLIVRAAASAGLSEQEIVDYSEDNHKVRTFLDRLLGRPVMVTHTRIWKESSTGAQVPEDVSFDEEVAVTLVQRAIRSAYKTGNLIIVGRGGQVLLKDEPGVLHVRIEAPMEQRIQHVKDQIRQDRQFFYADIDLRREAQDLINERDSASADYIRRFYNVEWDNPMLYHLVINMGKLSFEQAVEIITRLAHETQPAGTINAELLPYG